FLLRVRPLSTSAKPACMNMTRKAATNTQVRFSAVSNSASRAAKSRRVESPIEALRRVVCDEPRVSRVSHELRIEGDAPCRSSSVPHVHRARTLHLEDEVQCSRKRAETD